MKLEPLLRLFVLLFGFEYREVSVFGFSIQKLTEETFPVTLKTRWTNNIRSISKIDSTLGEYKVSGSVLGNYREPHSGFSPRSPEMGSIVFPGKQGRRRKGKMIFSEFPELIGMGMGSSSSSSYQTFPQDNVFLQFPGYEQEDLAGAGTGSVLAGSSSSSIDEDWSPADPDPDTDLEILPKRDPSFSPITFPER